MRRSALLILCACGSSAPPPAPPPPAVKLLTVQPTQVVDATEYLGMLRSRSAATIQPQVGGRITQLLVKPGDQVTVGQPLAQIDPGSQPAAIAQARASQQASQAQLELAQQNLQRTQRLVAEHAVPRQELDNAMSAVAAARAQVAAQGAQITGGVVQLRYYKVVAPTAGTIGDVPVRVGDTITPQNRLTTITDNSVLEANISIPVERAPELSRSTRVDIVSDAGEVIGSGTVKFISPDVDRTTQSLLVKADIPNPKGVLRSDQVVRARVDWREYQGIQVPALAVTRVGGQPFVYVAAAKPPGMVAEQRPVELGDLANGSYVIRKGLAPGDRIVTSNLQKLRNGAPIKPEA
jgi:RND family efflux transporter MFP subunit